MISEETAAKIVYRLLAVLAGFTLCIGLLLVWDWGLIPRKTVATGTVTTEDGLTLPTRKYESYFIIRTTELRPPDIKKLNEEVQLPSGKWIDCRKDCLRSDAQHVKRRSIPVSEFQPQLRP